MKLMSIPCAILLASVGVLDGDRAAAKLDGPNSYPPRSFASAVDLTNWGQTSTFGGGCVTKYQVGEHAIHVVRRAYTWGAASSDLAVYVRKNNSHDFHLAVFQPARYMALSIRLNGDDLSCEGEDPKSGKRVTLLVINRAFFDTCPALWE
jgi:hypothetical protein